MYYADAYSIGDHIGVHIGGDALSLVDLLVVENISEFWC